MMCNCVPAWALLCFVYYQWNSSSCKFICWVILGLLGGFLKAKISGLVVRPKFWSGFGSKKLLLKTLAVRWLPARVFDGPFGGFCRPFSEPVLKLNWILGYLGPCENHIWGC